jgi:hypothetical protein
VLDPRGQLLGAALGFVGLPSNDHALHDLRSYLDSWSGIGRIAVGMAHQGWDVQLTAYAARDWRATFFPVGIAHSVVGGTAWEPTPWRAVQRAAWEALTEEVKLIASSRELPGQIQPHHTTYEG